MSNRGQIANQSQPRIIFNKNEFKDLAQLIMAQYHKCKTEVDLKLDPPKSLSQAFEFIIVLKEKTILSYSELCKKQLQQLQKMTHINHSEHIRHAPQEELKIQIEQHKKQKILLRVIELKNSKHQQLTHMSLKYDQLLNEIKKMRDKNESLSNTYRLVIEEIKNKDKQLAQLRQERKKQEYRYQKYVKKVQRITEQAKILKQVSKSVRTQIAQAIKKLISNWVGLFQQLKSKLENFVRQQKQQMTILQNTRVNIQKQSIRRQAQDKQTIQQLINDLSVAIGYQLRQNQPPKVWLQHYRQYKRNKVQANDLKSYKQKVYMPLNLTEQDQFIARQRNLLGRFKYNEAPAPVSVPVHTPVFGLNLFQSKNVK